MSCYQIDFQQLQGLGQITSTQQISSNYSKNCDLQIEHKQRARRQTERQTGRQADKFNSRQTAILLQKEILNCGSISSGCGSCLQPHKPNIPLKRNVESMQYSHDSKMPMPWFKVTAIYLSQDVIAFRLNFVKL